MSGEAATPPVVARAIVEGALGLRKGEELLVASWNHTLPWASACIAEARRLGGRGTLLLEDETAFWRSVDIAPSTRSWSGLTPALRAAVRGADALVYFAGPADRPRLHALSAAQLAPLLGVEEAWQDLCRATGVRGVRCLLGYASDAQGDKWGVPGAMWRSQMIRAVADADLRAIRASGLRVARRLGHGRELRITAANGTDVRLTLRGRAPWVDDGIVDADDLKRRHPIATAPAGTVVVAVDEDSAAGTAVATRPSFLTAGRADGGQWDLEHGRLRTYWYTNGGEAFEREFALAPRGREIVGLFALGLNPSLAPGVPHAEDAEAGTVTLAVGGNTVYGGRNRSRFLSWITIGEATVALDGAPLVDRGEIL